MTRKDYWREYHAKNRDKRREQMMARYFATGGHKGRLIREVQKCDTSAYAPA
jgi:hypothetical protein